MDSVLADKSADLALSIIEYYKWLSSEKKEYVMSKQILRSGTSIGANVREAVYAVSKADFINKMQIALKEAGETEYWLYLLQKSGFYDNCFHMISDTLDEVKRMLVATLKTAKKI